MSKLCQQKRKYRTELDAKIALASAQRRDKGEKRTYRCPHCHRWHLTSQEVRGELRPQPV